MRDKLQFLKRPWAITRDAFEVLSGYDLEAIESASILEDLNPEDFEEKLVIDEGTGIAVLSMKGALMPSPSLASRFFHGAVDLVRVESLIRGAQASGEVKQLVIRIDTGGGTVSGTPEVANAVEDFVASGKPLRVFSNGIVASAGYWIAAPATEIVGTVSSLWGSVGVIRPHIDMSEARRQAGIKVELFTSGKHKGAGALGTSLSDEQRSEITSEIDKLGEKFRTHVSTHRAIERGNMEALTYYADDALALGYIDRIVSNFEEFLAGLGAAQDAAENTDGGSVDMTLLSEQKNNPAKIPTMEKTPEENATEAATEAKALADAIEAKALDDAATEAQVLADATEAKALTDTADASATEPTLSEDQLAAFEASVEAKLEAKLEAIFSAKVEARAEELAIQKAAKIAAQSATDAASVTPDGDENASNETRYASLDENQRWDEYNKIRTEKGDNDARSFYVKYMEGK